jgi:hypothetical protein
MCWADPSIRRCRCRNVRVDNESPRDIDLDAARAGDCVVNLVGGSHRSSSPRRSKLVVQLMLLVASHLCHLPPKSAAFENVGRRGGVVMVDERRHCRGVGGAAFGWAEGSIAQGVCAGQLGQQQHTSTSSADG